VMARRGSAYAKFLILFRRGYLRDHIARIMHAEGYDVPTREIRKWFASASPAARAERKGALKLLSCVKRDERGRCVRLNQADRVWGYLYRIRSRLSPRAAEAAWAWRAGYGGAEEAGD